MSMLELLEASQGKHMGSEIRELLCWTEIDFCPFSVRLFGDTS